MKLAVVVACCVAASASAFAPTAFNTRSSVALSAAKKKAAKKPFFESVFEMDLFSPNKEVNDYGARNKKNLKTGKIGAGSYVPSGLSAAEYQKIRDKDDAKKAATYKWAAAKGGKFIDASKWNGDREKNPNFMKSPTRGHDMAKTKFDWSGKKDETKKNDASV